MNKSLRILILTALTAILLLFILYNYSVKDSLKKNGFNRKFLANNPVMTGNLSLEPRRYAIANVSPDQVILYDVKRPTMLTEVQMDLKRATKDTLRVKLGEKADEGINSLTFYSDRSYLLIGKTASIYKGGTGDKTWQTLKRDTTPFYHSATLDSSTFIYMVQKPYQGINRRTIKKINLSNNKTKFYLPAMQGDGYFSNDGQFRYDAVSKKIVYLFFYRGEFDCLDTGMNIIYKAKTIDTVRYSKTNLQKNKISYRGRDYNKIRQAKLPLIVNRRLSISGGLIFIQSYLKADNEDARSFDHSEVIDIYHLADGKYYASFYLPKVERKKLTQFVVYGNNLVALYQNAIVIFDMSIIN